MTKTPQDFVAQNYNLRASDYVNSNVHAQGDDLQEIKTLLYNETNATILDLGCGGGHVSYITAPLVNKVIACDITKTMLDAVQQTATERSLNNITTTQASAEDLPFPDCKFDWVISRFSAHHWFDLNLGIKEVKRILRPKGKAIFIDTLAPLDKTSDSHLQTIELLRDRSHVRNYTLSEWVDLFSIYQLNLINITQRSLYLNFNDWIKRTNTSIEMANAIKKLQQNAPNHVKEFLLFHEDGSFTLPTATLVVQK